MAATKPHLLLFIYLLIFVAVVATALPVERWFLRRFYDRWRLVEVLVLGAFANGVMWGLCVGMLVWFGMRYMDDIGHIPHSPWYGFFIPWSCLSIVFGLVGLVPACMVALVYRRRKNCQKPPAKPSKCQFSLLTLLFRK